jgi:cation transport regulator ChaC
MSVYVFAYGSLTLRRAPAPEHRLTDFARVWNVAMDNRRDLPGYKYYRDLDTGERPAIHVAFLNLASDPGVATNGALLEVTRAELAALDARERNYDRITVTDLVDPEPDGTVYAYVGKPEARERFAQAVAAAACAVDAAYLDGVRAGFRALGPGALRRFDACTPRPPVPVRRLHRHDLPARS